MSKTRRIIGYVVASVMILMIAVLMFGCQKNDPDPNARVMSLSVNPEIEVVLDSNNKVVSVSAENEEGHYILANATFEGKTAEEAAKLFIEVAKAGGLVEGGVEFEIELSGANAKKLLDQVKGSVNTYLSENNINVVIDAEIMSKDDLEDMLEDCMKELTEAEIHAMTEEQIINHLKDMHEQTKDFTSQQMKEVYYDLRLNEIEKAEIQAKLNKLKEISDPILATAIFSAVQTLEAELANLETTFAQIEENLKMYFFDENESEYPDAMAAYVAKKKELMAERLGNADPTVIAQIKVEIANAEVAIESVENVIDGALATLKTTKSTILSQINTALTTAINVLSNLGGNIDVNVDVDTGELTATFAADFKADFAAYNTNLWA